MLWLLIGLIVFIGIHSISIFKPSWRTQMIESKGEGTYLMLYTLISIIGLALIIWGYGQTRVDAHFVWNPPRGLFSVTIILSLIAFVFLAAVNVPNNHFKKAVGHPMIIGVKLWAFGHLLANGRLGDILLFGTFLIWAIAYYAVNRRRDRQNDVVHVSVASAGATAVTVLVGTLVWGIFAFLLHEYLIGVKPV